MTASLAIHHHCPHHLSHPQVPHRHGGDVAEEGGVGECCIMGAGTGPYAHGRVGSPHWGGGGGGGRVGEGEEGGGEGGGAKVPTHHHHLPRGACAGCDGGQGWGKVGGGERGGGDATALPPHRHTPHQSRATTGAQDAGQGGVGREYGTGEGSVGIAPRGATKGGTDATGTAPKVRARDHHLTAPLGEGGGIVGGAPHTRYAGGGKPQVGSGHGARGRECIGGLPTHCNLS